MSFFSTYERKQLVAILKGYVTMEFSAKNPNTTKHDKKYKQKAKLNAEKTNTKHHNFAVGDQVLVKQKRTNKLATTFEPNAYTITKIKGSSIQAKRLSDGREIFRDASYFKLMKSADRKHSKCTNS